MTWNVWWRFGDPDARERAITQVLDDVRPDVVCLQECWVDRNGDGTVGRLAARTGHGVANEPVWFDGAEVAFANGIMSRWPVERVLDAALPGSDGRPGHRRVLGAVVETPWGRWPFVSTHLDHRFDASTTRLRQVQAVLGHVVDLRGDPDVDLPVVLGADLNAVPDSDEVRTLTGRRAGGPGGVVMSDVWEQVGRGDGATWRRAHPEVADSAWPDRRLDVIAVSWPRPKPTGNPVRAWLAGHAPVLVDGSPVWPSDHAAVVAELRTP